jgi:hypothetical protein
MSITEIITKYGTEDKKHDLGNGFELITRYVVNVDKISVEYAVYKDGHRLMHPDMLDEDEFPEENYNRYESAIRSVKEDRMFSVEEGILEETSNLTAKNMWYAVGDTYSVKDTLKESKMQWEPSIKAWASLTKPEINDVEFIQMKTYKTENGWTWY